MVFSIFLVDNLIDIDAQGIIIKQWIFIPIKYTSLFFLSFVYWTWEVDRHARAAKEWRWFDKTWKVCILVECFLLLFIFCGSFWKRMSNVGWCYVIINLRSNIVFVSTTMCESDKKLIWFFSAWIPALCLTFLASLIWISPPRTKF